MSTGQERMLRFTTTSVLAGAYGLPGTYGRTKATQKYLRHAVELDADERYMVRVVCGGPRVDNMADDFHDLLALNCPRCIRALQRKR